MMRIRVGKWDLGCAGTRSGILLGIACWLVLSSSLSTAQSDLIGDVQSQLAQNSFTAAESELRAYKAQHGATPEYLEALSWMARGAATMQQWTQASAYASETRSLAESQLAKRKLDAEPHLPTAL